MRLQSEPGYWGKAVGLMRRPSFVQVRTFVLFTAGLAGVAYETLVSSADRPTLLILFAAMMGLPLFLKADEKTRAHVPQLTGAMTTPDAAGDSDSGGDGD